jgi:hypothetical protein
MKAFQFTTNKTVRRLLWVAVGATLLDSVVTLLSPSAQYCLMRGAPIVLLYDTISLLSIFVLTQSAVPRKVALAGLFSLILTHYFGASNLLLYQWNLDWVTLVYGVILAVIVALLALPPTDTIGPSRESTDVGFDADKIVKGLCWLMVAAWSIDKINTVLGQPATYWSHPETANEGFQLDRFFMVRGISVYVLYQLTFVSGLSLLLFRLPKWLGISGALFQIISSYFGASTWLYYHWHLGAAAPIVYSVILSLLLAWLAFPGRRRNAAVAPAQKCPRVFRRACS